MEYVLINTGSEFLHFFQRYQLADRFAGKWRIAYTCVEDLPIYFSVTRRYFKVNFPKFKSDMEARAFVVELQRMGEVVRG